jgi:hypothetical protein
MPSTIHLSDQFAKVQYLAASGASEPERWHGPAPLRCAGQARSTMAGTGTRIHGAISTYAVSRPRRHLCAPPT